MKKRLNEHLHQSVTGLVSDVMPSIFNIFKEGFLSWRKQLIFKTV